MGNMKYSFLFCWSLTEDWGWCKQVVDSNVLILEMLGISASCCTCIPANFFSVKCVRFFVSTEPEFLMIYQHLPKIAEDFERLPNIAEGFQQLPKIFRQLSTITEGVDRCLMPSKQGQQQFPKDFQSILTIIEEFRRCSDDFSNIKKTIEFLFNRFLSNYTRYCQLGMRN